jgi:hypothetical protein
MSEAPLTLATLFELDPDRLGEQATAALRSSRGIQDLPGMLGFRDREAVWSSATSCIARALHGALDVPLSAILSGAWNSYRELLEYTDPVRHPPQQAALHTLSEHTIRVTQHPTVELLIDGVRAGRLTFDAELDARIESAVLSIQAGRIYEVRVGTCRFTGKLSYGEALLASRTSAEYHFPGTIAIPGGMPIAPREPAPAGG